MGMLLTLTVLSCYGCYGPSLFLFLVYFSVKYINKASKFHTNCSIALKHQCDQQIFHILHTLFDTPIAEVRMEWNC